MSAALRERRRLQVLGIACCLLAAPVPSARAELAAPSQSSQPASAAAQAAAAQAAAAQAAGPAMAVAPGVVAWPEGARISLELKRVPLATLLSMLGAQTGLRFRLATIPDVEVSVSLQNAPLQQAVRDLLAFHGFDLRPGPDAFWLVDAPDPARSPLSADPASAGLDGGRRSRGSVSTAASALASRSGGGGKVIEPWRWWTSAQAPPPRWMAPGAAEVAYEGVPSDSGVPGVGPFGVRVRLQPQALALSRWKGGAQKFVAASPGVLPSLAVPRSASVSLHSPTGAAGSGSASIRWCARWPVFLRSVPARCLLVIESERPANLYINGARLLHLWAGRRTLEVSGSLQAGSNLLALEWPTGTPGASAPAVAGSQASAAPLPSTFSTASPAPPPAVRYEWFVAQ